MSENQSEIAVVMCGPMVGVSGGDTHALRLVTEYVRRYPGAICLIAPSSVVPYLPPFARSVSIELRTPLDRGVRRIPIYAMVIGWRAIQTIVRMPRVEVCIASSHFIQDVLPCAVRRWTHRTRTVAYVYHLVDDMQRSGDLRSRLSVLAEKISLALLRRTADLVFADNRTVAESLEIRGFAPDTIVMTENAFDPLLPLPDRKDDGTPVIAFCGRLTAEKGAREVIALAARLHEEVRDARVEIMGDGPLRQELEGRIAELGLDNITLRGFVSEAEKWALLRSATLFVAPSSEEGWGIAVGEALVAGTPVLAYDLPAYEYLGDLVLRVPLGSSEQFTAEALRLLSKPRTLDEQRSVVMNAGDRLPRWDAIFDAEFGAIRSLIE